MQDATLIQALQSPQLYQHEVEGFTLCETHISWVILTGGYAYKIKKPVNFGFLDFTSVEQRRHYCQLELELNRRLAADLYVEVLPIFGTLESPSFKPLGEPIEYAIKMRQFKQENLFANLAKHNKLNDMLIQDTARQMALFHRKAKTVSPKNEFGSLEHISAPVNDNFSCLRGMPFVAPFFKQLDTIQQWAEERFAALSPLFISRKQQGFVKACHGDLHLGNIVTYSGKPLIFDCIEFNDSFRHTDTMNDIAFMAMDLKHKKQPQWANLFANTYAEWSNDFEGLICVSFYESYRAMVRAKVCALQAQHLEPKSTQYKELLQDMQDFIALAHQITEPKQAKLSITFGPSGSGKSVYSKQVMMIDDAIRLRSDVIRKHIHGLPPFKAIDKSQHSTLYTTDATAKTFATLITHATTLLKNQHHVIVDATFIKQHQRERFIQLAKALNVEVEILQFDIPVDIMKANIGKRRQAKLNPSDADEHVLEKQLEQIDPLTPEEQQFAKVIRQED